MPTRKIVGLTSLLLRNKRVTLSLYKKTGVQPRVGSRFLFLGVAAFALWAGCSLVQTRPVQEMSDAAAAIRAAREVQADTLSPELFRQANETFFRAKNEYRLKNFVEAKQYADQAKNFAEQSEFEVIRFGSARNSNQLPDPLAEGGLGSAEATAQEKQRASMPKTKLTPNTYASPSAIPVESYESWEKDYKAEQSKKFQYKNFSGNNPTTNYNTNGLARPNTGTQGQQTSQQQAPN